MDGSDKTKPGIKTTEFWGMVVVMIIGMIVTSIGTYKANEGMVGVGGIMIAVAQGAYSTSRGKAKSRATEIPQ